MNQEQAVRTLIKAASAGDYEAGVILNNWANEKQAGVIGRLKQFASSAGGENVAAYMKQAIKTFSSSSKPVTYHTARAILEPIAIAHGALSKAHSLKKTVAAEKLTHAFATKISKTHGAVKKALLVEEYNNAMKSLVNKKYVGIKENVVGRIKDNESLQKAKKFITENKGKIALGLAGVGGVGGAGYYFAKKESSDSNLDYFPEVDDYESLENYDYDEDEINQLKAASFVENLYASAYQNAYAEGLKTASAEWEQMALEDMGY